MPLFAASISMRKLPGLDMVIGRLFRNCQLLALPHPAMASNTMSQSFSRLISAVLCYFFFAPGYIAKGKYSFFHLVFGGNLGGNLWGDMGGNRIFTSSP